MPAHKKVNQIRTRFNGFTLNASKRDRAVADYINEHPNISERIKQLLYEDATGIRIPREPAPEIVERDDPRVAMMMGAID